jgi:hypothetical protein
MRYITLMAYVYQHIRLDKDIVFYIGIGSDNNGLYNRAYSKNRSEHWKRIVSKGGYEVQVIADNLTWEEACMHEKRFINFYGRENLNEGKLINLTDGGDGCVGQVMSEEAKEKISKNHSRHNLGKEFPAEVRQKISAGRMGHEAWNKGGKFSDEIKKKMSESSKGQTPWNKGGKMPKSYIDKVKDVPKSKYIIDALVEGSVAFHTGRPKSTEQREKMSKSMRETWAKKKAEGFVRIPWNKGKKKNKNS